VEGSIQIHQRENKESEGSDILFTGSGEFTNEDNYVMQKLARVAFKTNNIDCCARLCHVSTAKALHEAYGLSAMPTVMDDAGCGLHLCCRDKSCVQLPGFFQPDTRGKEPRREAYHCARSAERDVEIKRYPHECSL